VSGHRPPHGPSGACAGRMANSRPPTGDGRLGTSKEKPRLTEVAAAQPPQSFRAIRPCRRPPGELAELEIQPGRLEQVPPVPSTLLKVSGQVPHCRLHFLSGTSLPRPTKMFGVHRPPFPASLAATMPNGHPHVLILGAIDIGQSNPQLPYPRGAGLGAMGYQNPKHRSGGQGRRHSFIHLLTPSRAAPPVRRFYSSGQRRDPHTASARWVCPAPRPGYQAEDSHHRRMLQAPGYRTGQFGKNHFGDRDEASADDCTASIEFFGTCKSPFNAEENRSCGTIPPKPIFRTLKRISVPGVCCIAGQRRRAPQRIEKKNPARSPKANGDGRRGVHEGAKRFIKEAVASVAKPFFVWSTPPNMHFRHPLPVPQDVGQSGRCNRNTTT